ncbi:hypothetical protein D3C80_1586530 [compost metagenome]
MGLAVRGDQRQGLVQRGDGVRMLLDGPLALRAGLALDVALGGLDGLNLGQALGLDRVDLRLHVSADGIDLRLIVALDAVQLVAHALQLGIPRRGRCLDL